MNKEWALKELELYKERYAKNYDGEGMDNFISSLEGLFNNYEERFEHDYRYYLDRLLKGLPMTSIHDTEDAWEYNDSNSNDGQCKRYPALFKSVSDGVVSYNDVNRVICYDPDYPAIKFHNSVANRVVNELYPIEMPYLPRFDKFEVEMKYYNTNPAHGDYVTVSIHNIKTPDGRIVKVMRYFHDVDGCMVEINSAVLQRYIGMRYDMIEQNKVFERMQYARKTSPNMK